MAEIDLKATGQAFRTIREQRGAWLTPPRLAKLAGVSRAAVNKVESGERRPTERYLLRVAPHLGMTEGDALKLGGYSTVPLMADEDVPDNPFVTIVLALLKAQWPAPTIAATFGMLAETHRLLTSGSQPADMDDAQQIIQSLAADKR